MVEQAIKEKEIGKYKELIHTIIQIQNHAYFMGKQKKQM
jgi:hypothetical protein